MSNINLPTANLSLKEGSSSGSVNFGQTTKPQVVKPNLQILTEVDPSKNLNAVGKALGYIEEYQKRSQDMEKKVLLNQGTNEYQQRVNEILGRYKQLKGKNAIDGWEQYQSDLRSLNEEYKGVFSRFDDMDASFTQSQNSINNRALLEATNYKDNQIRTAQENELNGKVATSLDTYIQNFGSPLESDYFDDIRKSYTELASFKGLDIEGDAFEAGFKEVMNPAAKSSIGLQLDNEQFSAARASLERLKPHISAITYKSLLGDINSKARNWYEREVERKQLKEERERLAADRAAQKKEEADRKAAEKMFAPLTPAEEQRMRETEMPKIISELLSKSGNESVTYADAENVADKMITRKILMINSERASRKKEDYHLNKSLKDFVYSVKASSTDGIDVSYTSLLQQGDYQLWSAWENLHSNLSLQQREDYLRNLADSMDWNVNLTSAQTLLSMDDKQLLNLIPNSEALTEYQLKNGNFEYKAGQKLESRLNKLWTGEITNPHGIIRTTIANEFMSRFNLSKNDLYDPSMATEVYLYNKAIDSALKDVLTASQKDKNIVDHLPTYLATSEFTSEWFDAEKEKIEQAKNDIESVYDALDDNDNLNSDVTEEEAQRFISDCQYRFLSENDRLPTQAELVQFVKKNDLSRPIYRRITASVQVPVSNEELNKDPKTGTTQFDDKGNVIVTEQKDNQPQAPRISVNYDGQETSLTQREIDSIVKENKEKEARAKEYRSKANKSSDAQKREEYLNMALAMEESVKKIVIHSKAEQNKNTTSNKGDGNYIAVTINNINNQLNQLDKVYKAEQNPEKKEEIRRQYIDTLAKSEALQISWNLDKKLEKLDREISTVNAEIKSASDKLILSKDDKEKIQALKSKLNSLKRQRHSVEKEYLELNPIALIRAMQKI